MFDNDENEGTGELRRKAEDLVKSASVSGAFSMPDLSETDILKLIHELQVHQVELEMQNEELRHAWAVGQIAVDKYTQLYEFAPTGYFSLSREGKITDINFSASQMLGKERLRLKNSSFIFFVSNDTKPVFRHFFENVFAGKTREMCELALATGGNSPFYVQLTGRLTENEDQCLVAMIDVTERLRLEKEVKEREEKYRIIVTTCRDALFLIDPESGAILDANDAACKLYGFSTEELKELKNTDLSFEPAANRMIHGQELHGTNATVERAVTLVVAADEGHAGGKAIPQQPVIRRVGATQLEVGKGGSDHLRLRIVVDDAQSQENSFRRGTSVQFCAQALPACDSENGEGLADPRRVVRSVPQVLHAPGLAVHSQLGVGVAPSGDVRAEVGSNQPQNQNDS